MKLTIILLVFLLATINVFGQTTLPDTIPGKLAKAFLQMVNSTKDSDLENFLKNEMTPNNEITPKERLALFQRIRQDLSGSEVQNILETNDKMISFAVKTSSDRILKITLELSPEQDNRIGGIGLEMMPDTAMTQPTKVVKKMPKTGLLPSIKSYLDDLAKSDEFSGVVLIAKDGKPVFENAYGFANKGFQVPNKLDTKFNIGSLNKTFTTIAIGILADEGKLSLDDKIGKHLPGYPNKEAAEKATIYHLLTMTSGISDIFGEEYDSTPKDKLRTISDYVPLFASKPLEFEPGSSQQYSNGGFLVLGAIIEKASGKNYYDFVRARIFEPIGMKDTDSYAIDEVIPNMANGYTLGEFGKTKGERKNNIYTLPSRGSSAGGGYSTAGDLLKFANAIDSGRFSVPESLKMSKGIMTADMLMRGFRLGGGAFGVNSMIFSKLPGNHTVIILSNYDPPSAEKVGMQIADWIEKN